MLDLTQSLRITKLDLPLKIVINNYSRTNHRDPSLEVKKNVVPKKEIVSKQTSHTIYVYKWPNACLTLNLTNRVTYSSSTTSLNKLSFRNMKAKLEAI